MPRLTRGMWSCKWACRPGQQMLQVRRPRLSPPPQACSSTSFTRPCRRCCGAIPARSSPDSRRLPQPAARTACPSSPPSRWRGCGHDEQRLAQLVLPQQHRLAVPQPRPWLAGPPLPPCPQARTLVQADPGRPAAAPGTRHAQHRTWWVALWFVARSDWQLIACRSSTHNPSLSCWAPGASTQPHQRCPTCPTMASKP